MRQTSDQFIDPDQYTTLDHWWWREPATAHDYELIEMDGLYGLRTGGATFDGDAWEDTWWFSRRPTEDEARSFVAAVGIEREIDDRRAQNPWRNPWGDRVWNDRLVCRTCGRDCHWLDLDGSLAAKFARVEERWCGC